MMETFPTTLTTLRMAMALVPAFTEKPQQQDVRHGILILDDPDPG